MIIALTGSHRTGKTSVLEQLRCTRPEWNYLAEPARTIAPIIDFSNPERFLAKHGIAMLQAIQISLFAGLVPVLNPVCSTGQVDAEPTIVDRTPLDYMAYFDLFKTDDEIKHEKLLTDLASYFMSNIDLVIYFPPGVFELPDEPGDPQGKGLQSAIDTHLKARLKQDARPTHVLRSITPEARAEEIAELVMLHGKDQ